MDVPKFVEFVDRSEHFGDVELRVFFFQDARIIQQGTEVTTWDVFHGEIHELRVLESVEKSNEPWSLGRCEDIPFYQNVAHLESEVNVDGGIVVIGLNSPRPSWIVFSSASFSAHKLRRSPASVPKKLRHNRPGRPVQ